MELHLIKAPENRGPPHIWPCIDHEDYCDAEPYLPVSESASKRFKEVKARFNAKRKAWADAKAKMTPEELKSYLDARRDTRIKREADALAEANKAAQKGLQKSKRRDARSPKVQKAKKASKVRNKTAKKRRPLKKSAKRKKR